MAIDPKDIRIDLVSDKPRSGMWPCGPTACWITITHVPTLSSVRVYSGIRSQHQAREAAMTLLELMIDEIGEERCSFPENITHQQNIDSMEAEE